MASSEEALQQFGVFGLAEVHVRHCQGLHHLIDERLELVPRLAWLAELVNELINFFLAFFLAALAFFIKRGDFPGVLLFEEFSV